MDRNPYTPPSSDSEVVTAPTTGDGPEGIGGWLLLVCLGLILTPFRVGYYLLATFPPLFRDGSWHTLTTPGSPPYHPFWGPLLIGEIAINAFFIVTAIYLLVLFFRKSWRFPKFYVFFLVSNFVFIVLDALAIRIVLPGQPFLDAESAGEFAKSLVGVGIWVPYMFISKRVKNTFVRLDT